MKKLKTLALTCLVIAMLYLMFSDLRIGFAVVVIIEAWYWFIYFPRAWRDGSNQDINMIRATVRGEAWRP